MCRHEPLLALRVLAGQDSKGSVHPLCAKQVWCQADNDRVTLFEQTSFLLAHLGGRSGWVWEKGLLAKSCIAPKRPMRGRGEEEEWPPCVLDGEHLASLKTG